MFWRLPTPLNSFLYHFRGFDDSKTCWHGRNDIRYDDCNDGMTVTEKLKIKFGSIKCNWWHFTPKETYFDLKLKFDEIMEGS